MRTQWGGVLRKATGLLTAWGAETYRATGPRRVGIVYGVLVLVYTAITTWLPSRPAHAALVQFVSSPQRFETGTVWFRTRQGPVHTSGIVELGSGFFQTAALPSLSTYQGGSFSWTPNNVYLTLVGGGGTTVEVGTPDGTSITETQGIVILAFGFLVTLDTDTGLFTDVALNGAAYVYTPDKVYLVLVGGSITTIEVTSPSGGSVAGVKGMSVIAGTVDDDPTTPAVDAITQGGTLFYTDTHVYLHLLGGGFTTIEVLDAAQAPIARTLGIARMDGFIPPPGLGGLQGAAYVWTPRKVYLLLIGGGLVTTEVTTPEGGAIQGAWGVMKLDATFVFTDSGTVFQGAAQIVTSTHLYLSLVGGGMSTTEFTAPGGGAIVTHVRVRNSTSDIRQASELYGKAGQFVSPGDPMLRQNGTVIGLDQGSGGGT